MTKYLPPPPPPAPEQWLDDACILDMDYFVKTITGIKAKGVRPDLIGSIIAHYSSKWLPDLSPLLPSPNLKLLLHSDDTLTSAYMKKRFFVETLINILPADPHSVPCNFLLRLLRVGSTVGLGPSYRSQLEQRIGAQLDDADLKELLIPSFSHTCGTLLDVELVTRLVKRFGESSGGGGVGKVARLVDDYLAEAAVDSGLGVEEFVDLAAALPAHARATDDGMYRAIDTYLKAHPTLTKQEKKVVCRLIDTRKLSTEASLHASQNERLPVRAVIQVLFSEQTKHLTRQQLDWSGPFAMSSRSTAHASPSADLPTRCHSKREVGVQQMEIKRLKEEVGRLQSQCRNMEAQMERLAEKKKVGIFGWRKIGIISSFRNHGGGGDYGEETGGFGREAASATPKEARTVAGKGTGKGRGSKWRKSMS